MATSPPKPVMEKLFRINQMHLLEHWGSLSLEQQKELLCSIELVQENIFSLQQQLISKQDPAQPPIEPFNRFAESGSDLALFKRGKEQIFEGRLGCLLLAGGQGTRLGFNGPKGCYPISLIRRKSLFQLFAEKVLSASKQAGKPLLLAIMVSTETEEEVKAFFTQNNRFGLSRDQLFFFSQSELPFLDARGDLILQNPYQIAKGPDGNGRSLEHFILSGIWERWYELGVRHLNLILIDNPLADPFDAELLGFHCQQEADVTVKCTEKLTPEEKVGVLVRQNGRCRVIEYSEMQESEKYALDEGARLKHRCANLSLFCLTMDFICNAVKSKEPLPLHKAWKKTPILASDGHSSTPSLPNAWKFEYFIFDLLKYANRVAALLYPREQCFSPLKNALGPDSPDTVRAALQRYDRLVLEKLTGLCEINQPFELSTDFYYPTSELIDRLRRTDKKDLSGYVSSELDA